MRTKFLYSSYEQVPEKELYLNTPKHLFTSLSYYNYSISRYLRNPKSLHRDY